MRPCHFNVFFLRLQFICCPYNKLAIYTGSTFSTTSNSSMAYRPSALLKSVTHPDEGRPASAPIPIPRTSRATERSSSIPPGPRARSRISHDGSTKDSTPDLTLDLTGLLQRSEPLVVKTRIGSVLSRGFILKTDHYPSGI